MTDEKPVRFWLRGAGGAPGKRDMRFWLSPLPPPGLLTFASAWRVMHISETRTVVDGEPYVRGRPDGDSSA
jgi:hypothetical protein